MADLYQENVIIKKVAREDAWYLFAHYVLLMPKSEVRESESLEIADLC